MPSTVHNRLDSDAAMVSAIINLQTFLGLPTSGKHMTKPHIAKAVIDLQTYLSTQNATNPPSNKKFDPAKINRYIDDQALAGKIIDLQNAANLT